MRKQFVLLFSFLLPLFVLAQDQFVVYSIKGEVTIPGKMKTIIVGAGQVISSINTITIGESAGITLLGKDGAFFSTTEPGDHLLSQFNDSCQKSNSTLLNSFFKFLYTQATIRSSDLPGKRRKNYFSDPEPRTGPVNRVWIDRKSFDTTNYSGISGDFGFYWLSYTKEKEHEFSLYAAPKTTGPFYQVMARNLRMPFADLASQVKPGNSYYWTANRKGDEDPGLFVFNYVTKQTYDSVLSGIAQQKPMVEGPAEEAYRTAFMLEYLHYLAEAYQYYIKSAELDTANTLYRSTLESFKKEFGIDKR